MYDLHQLNTHTHVWDNFDPSSVVPTKMVTDYLEATHVVSRAGSIWVRDLESVMSVEQSYSDFYAESVTDPMSVTDEALGPVDRPSDVTDAMSVTHSWTRTGGTTTPPPSAIFESNTSKGMVVYVSGDGYVDLADSTAAGTATAIGLARTAVTAGDTGKFQTDDQFTLLDWTAVTGGATLTPGAVYYLTTAGGMSATPPSSGSIVRIGLATTTTTMDIEIARPVLLA